MKDPHTLRIRDSKFWRPEDFYSGEEASQAERVFRELKSSFEASWRVRP